MTRTRSWPRLSTVVVRHRFWIAAFWAVAAIALVPQAARLPAVLETGANVEDSESSRVERLLAGPLRSAYADYVVLVVGGLPSPTTDVGATALRQALAPLADAPDVAGVVSYLDVRDTLLLGPRGSGALVLVGLSSGELPPDRLIPALRAIAARTAADLRPAYPDVTLRWTGESALNVDLRRTSAADVQRAERRALPLTAAILLLAFGAVAAAVLPVVTAALAIVLALGAAAVAAGLWPMSILLQSVVPMLGLGLGIDYALLMVNRFRDALAEHGDARAAAEEASRQAGHTILLSAATVALGFVVLLTVPLNEMRAIAVGGLLVVASCALLTTTLLPGALATLGARIDWGRVRRRSSRQASVRMWTRWGRLVTARPWTAVVLGALPLVLLAAQAGRLRTGLPRGDWLPSSMESTQALNDLRAMGRGGVIQSVRIVVAFPANSDVWQAEGWEGIARYAMALEGHPRIARVRSIVGVANTVGVSRSALLTMPELARALTTGLTSEDGRLVLLELIPSETVTPDDAVSLVREIRLAGAAPLGLEDAAVHVGGLPALNADYQDAVAGRFAGVVALVVAGTMLALFLGFRSVLVPLKAVALNLLSVAAAFGAVTLVFQDGHGASLLGVSEPLGAVFSSVPLVVFCIVFGLSMDYEVFLMTRVREARRAGLGNREAIVEALGRTGQVITNAAAIMLVVFAAFTLGDVLIIKMLGFALAVTVLLDATIVRMVVGPALLQLAGRWNWWPGHSADAPAATGRASSADGPAPNYGSHSTSGARV
ncbi:MAG TPA: MMPL family transporter [Gemmatimonadaceae bacterium]|nr:MMPL family transporter [Gemmatimonadaceae bacterium]